MEDQEKKVVHSSRSNPYERFSKKQILSIIEQIENETISRVEAWRKYGMAYCTLSGWLKRYGSLSATPQRAQISPQQQRQTARAVLDGRMTVKEAQAAYGISRPDTVRRWVRMLKHENSKLALYQQSPSVMPSPDSITNDNKDTELAEARLKITALETMIDLAEQHFKISIRKKSGAKQ